MIIVIDGTKEAFLSKNAVDKFKTYVKTNFNNLNMEELHNKYIKKEYRLDLTTNTDEQAVFKVIDLVENQKEENKKMLRAKLKLLTGRANVYNNRANSDIPDEILREYTKLKSMSKVPIPEPSEIFAKPDEFKPMIKLVLKNSMINKLGSKHPYVRYFTLLAQHLNISSDDDDDILNTNNIQPTQTTQTIQPTQLPNNIEELMKQAGTMESSLNDEDTDTEED